MYFCIGRCAIGKFDFAFCGMLVTHSLMFDASICCIYLCQFVKYDFVLQIYLNLFLFS